MPCLLSVVVYFASSWGFSGSFSTYKSIHLCHPANTLSLLYFVMIVFLMLGLVMIWRYANRSSFLPTALDGLVNLFSGNFLVLVSFPPFAFKSLTL